MAMCAFALLLILHHGCSGTGDAKRGKKNYMHALRTLNYALQLVREQAITDLEAPNHYWAEARRPPWGI
jgi:hypothetical protein